MKQFQIMTVIRNNYSQIIYICPHAKGDLSIIFCRIKHTHTYSQPSSIFKSQCQNPETQRGREEEEEDSELERDGKEESKKEKQCQIRTRIVSFKMYEMCTRKTIQTIEANSFVACMQLNILDFKLNPKHTFEDIIY